VKLVLTKKQVYYLFLMLVINNLLYSVGLRHMFISNILLMGMHWGSRYCIYACK